MHWRSAGSLGKVDRSIKLKTVGVDPPNTKLALIPPTTLFTPSMQVGHNGYPPEFGCLHMGA
jgi:hypothetical protein